MAQIVLKGRCVTWSAVITLPSGKASSRSTGTKDREEAQRIADSWESGASPIPESSIKPRPWFTCEVCEKPFAKHKGESANRACSKVCGVVLRAKDQMAFWALQRAEGHVSSDPNIYPPPPKECPWCGELFSSYNKCCSISCTYKCNAGKPKVTIRICVSCNKTFERPYGRGSVKTCSIKCSKDNARVSDRDSSRQAKYARKARMRAVKCEKVAPKSIFERDQYCCGICGDKTLSCEKVPHPLAPTLDHIVPLSKGGSHTAGNLQCAHFRCNSKKADSTDIKWNFLLS